MRREIIINNLKGIKHMDFVFPENTNVFLLVGSNGTGKTTLMTCMHRICDNNAFASGFRQPKSNGYDSYDNASIKYIIDGDEHKSITYSKQKDRWNPLPRNTKNVFDSFGFSESRFLAANSNRIDPKSDEIEKGTIVPVASEVREHLHNIFGTSKFDNLSKLVLKSHLGVKDDIDESKLIEMAGFKLKQYDVGFYVIEENGKYYTEKRFSTGEIAIVRLVNYICRYARDHALILIDEIEMALHPLVQIEFLNFLTKISKEKKLTVVVGTHSPALIKRVKKEQIILLARDVIDQGKIEITTPCYAARALGYVDLEPSATYDYIFFVEDDMARYYLQEMIKRFQEEFEVHKWAKIAIVPVGGFFETARLAVTTKKRLFQNSKVYALVDTDAFEKPMDRPKKKLEELQKDNPSIIGDLGVTPEVYYVDTITNNSSLKLVIKNEMYCEIDSVIQSDDYINASKGDNPRQIAKDQFKIIVNICKDYSGEHEEIIKEKLISLVVKYTDIEQLKKLLCQRFNAPQKI